MRGRRIALPVPKEQDLQMAVVRFLNLALPRERVAVEWTCFPAGGGGKIRGSILKGMGLKSGWPDLQFLYRGRMFFIELKRPGEKPEKHQRDLHDRLRHCGGHVDWADSVEQVEAILRRWGIPLVASVCMGNPNAFEQAIR
jgi:hypothetical protein